MLSVPLTLIELRCQLYVLLELPQTKQPSVSVHSKEGCVLENRVSVLETQIAELIKASAMAQSVNGLKNKSSDTSNKDQQVRQQPESVGQDGNDEPPDGSIVRIVQCLTIDNGNHVIVSNVTLLQSGRMLVIEVGQRCSSGIVVVTLYMVINNRMLLKRLREGMTLWCLLFNVTSDDDMESVKSYITNNDVEVLNIKMLPTKKEQTDCLMFKVDVHFEDKHKVLNSEFWPKNVGCREFYKRSRFEQRVVNQQKYDE